MKKLAQIETTYYKINRGGITYHSQDKSRVTRSLIWKTSLIFINTFAFLEIFHQDFS
jgi:hypothetical protein